MAPPDDGDRPPTAFREPAFREPVFQEPWEAKVFALVVTLRERGLFSWTDWTRTLAEEIGPGGEADYGAWLAALETLVVRGAVADRDTLASLRRAWDAAARRTPHGQPVLLAAGDA